MGVRPADHIIYLKRSDTHWYPFIGLRSGYSLSKRWLVGLRGGIGDAAEKVGEDASKLLGRISNRAEDGLRRTEAMKQASAENRRVLQLLAFFSVQD